MISILELFKIGIGPSSSHTVGPMKAAAAFANSLERAGILADITRLQITLFGSLAWTGRGHGTDKAVILGLSGLDPETVDPDNADLLVETVRVQGRLSLAGIQPIQFFPATDIVFDGVTPAPKHPNTLSLSAYAGETLAQSECWCSIGGGFVVPEESVGESVDLRTDVPFLFANSRQLLQLGELHELSIADMIMHNECAVRSRSLVEQRIAVIDTTMMACIDRGLGANGTLPGGLNVKRRAQALHERLIARQSSNQRLHSRDSRLGKSIRHCRQ